MKKSLIYLFIVAMSVTIANAQKGGAAFFKTGYLYAPGSSKVFQEIDPHRTGSFTNNYLIIGIEAYYRTGKTIVSWDGYSAQQADYSVGATTYAEPFISATYVRFGRIVKENKHSWLYPSVGLGIAATILETHDNVNKNSSNTINQTLLTPSLDIGINKDILIGHVSRGVKRYGGLILGLKAGYRTSVRSSRWRDDDWHVLYNMPSYSNNCFYFSVSIGAGSFKRK